MNNNYDDKTEIFDPKDEENTEEYPYNQENAQQDETVYGEHEYSDYEDSPTQEYQQYSPEDYTSPYSQVDISAFAFDNLPEEATSNEWVQRPYYDQLHDLSEGLFQDASEFHRSYWTAYRHNENLLSENESLKNEMNARSAENESAKARNARKEQELNERERKEEDDKIRKKWIIIALSVATALLAVSFIILGIKYNHEISNNQNNDNMSAVQQEQLNTMKDSMNKAQQEKNDALKSNQDLQNQVTKLQDDLKASDEKLKTAEESLKESNDTLDQMTEKINEMSTSAAQTTTATTTVTEQATGGYGNSTVTTTVEVPSDRSDLNTTTTSRN